MNDEGLRFKNELLVHTTYYFTFDKIVSKLKTIPRLDKLKKNREFILFICRLVENHIPHNDKKHPVDKEKLVIEIYIELFGEIDDYYRHELSLYIDYLHVLNKIKPGSQFRIFRHHSSVFFCKNLIGYG